MRRQIKLLRGWQRIAGEIVVSGGMATKSLVGDKLRAEFGIDAADAHEVCNDAQHFNIKPYHPSKCNEWGSALWARELITARTLNKLLR